VGKSTLVKRLEPSLNINLASQRVYLDHLRDPELIERMVAAQSKTSLIYIDEVQRIPEMLNTVQMIIDDNSSVRFALPIAMIAILKLIG
jgi:predicted AAA+ superfamily ATPase